MKAYEIALFLMLANACFNIVNFMGIWGGSQIYYGPGISENLQAAAPSSSIGTVELIISAVSLVVQSLIALLLIIAYSTILLPAFLFQVGMMPIFNMVFTLGVWITYIIGYTQWKAGRTMMGTE